MVLFIGPQFAHLRASLDLLLDQVASGELYDYRAHDQFRASIRTAGYAADLALQDTTDDLLASERIRLIFRTNISLRLGWRQWEATQQPASIDLIPADELVRVGVRK